jgi:hypothetical protein
VKQSSGTGVLEGLSRFGALSPYVFDRLLGQPFLNARHFDMIEFGSRQEPAARRSEAVEALS